MSVFQLIASVPGAAQANPLLALTQGQYSTESKQEQAARMIQDARDGYDPADSGSPDGKTNDASGLVGDSLTQCQQMILTYGMGPSLGNFKTAIIPDAILAAVKDPDNIGPSDFWNASNAQAGIATVAGVTPLVTIGDVINPHTGKRFNGVLVLPAA